MPDFTCVWTGNDNSPPKKWFDPWKRNVWKAWLSGEILVVVGHGGHPDSTFSHVNPRTREVEKFRLGIGQQIEVKWLNSWGFKYYVMAMGGAVRTTVQFDQFTSKGPITHGFTITGDALRKVGLGHLAAAAPTDLL